MRKDMFKVIVVRPRLTIDAVRKGRSHPHDHLPTRIGLRRAAREAGGYKTLNENLAPLRRYLGKQVGRPWNKVYSEICAHLKPASTVQQHVRDHIKDFVQLHPRDDMRVWPGSDRRWWQDFYVDRRDGLLKRTNRLAWARKPKKG